MFSFYNDISEFTIVNKVVNYLEQADFNLTPMELSFGMNEIIRQETGINDPLKLVKRESNTKALQLIERAKQIIEESKEPLFDAIKIAIAGNIIDYGMKSEYNLSKTLEEVMVKKPFINDYKLLEERLAKATTLTFLADNSGEIVFDKLLIEQIVSSYNLEKIYLIVKKYPFVNDVLEEDLEGLGFEEIPNLEIVALENLISKNYTELIKPYINQADLTIAKGQGNFELLYDRKLGIFFLFLVKCEIVKEILHSEEEDLMIAFN